MRNTSGGRGSGSSKGSGFRSWGASSRGSSAKSGTSSPSSGGSNRSSNGFGTTRSGYKTFKDSASGKTALVHRRVAEKKVGGRIFTGHEVHHIDGDKGNNRPSNLTVLTSQEHRALHREQRRNPSPGNDTGRERPGLLETIRKLFNP